MKRKSLPVVYIEYFVVRTLLAVIQALSFRAASFLAKAVGTVIYHLDKRHRQIALDNLKHALGGELGDADLKRLARASFQHLVLVGVEMAHAARLMTPRQWRRYIAIQGIEHFYKVCALGRGAIFVTGHVGNWELAGRALRFLGADCYFVMRPMDNPLLEKLIRDFRQATGVAVSKRGALRVLTKALRDGKFLGILVDQDARKDGVFVEFFGRPASTVRSVAALALRMDVPILTGYVEPVDGKFFFKGYLDPPIYPVRTGDRDADILRLTQQFTSRIESYIRKIPHRWLWVHRRWKTNPPPQARS